MSRDKRHGKQRERYQRKRRRALKGLQQQTREAFAGREVRFGTPSDGTKMSEVLQAFVEPYAEDIETKEELELLLTLAVAAWNAALLPKQEGVIEPILAAIPTGLRADGRRLLREMLARKRSKFADYERGIINFRVTNMPDGSWHLSVVSSVGPLSAKDMVPGTRRGFWAWLRSLWSWR